jgi:RNA polymerase sigma-70 factor (ECF subfamily)
MTALEESCPGPLPDPAASRSLELLARAQGGDAKALNELVSGLQERLLRIVRIRLGPAGSGLRRYLESGDIAQETWRAACGALGDLRVSGGSDLLHWLARIATNQIRDQLDRVNAQRRARDRERGLAESSNAEPPDPRSGPASVAARNEVAEVLDAAIAELPEEYREVILLRDYCAADWDSIAPRVGRDSVHAAQQLHQRAWMKVRRIAGPRLGGGR